MRKGGVPKGGVKEYDVIIQETLAKTVPVRVKSYAEALEIAEPRMISLMLIFLYI